MRCFFSSIAALLALTVVSPAGAESKEIRIERQPDGTLRVTNRPEGDRARGAWRVKDEDGALRLVLRGGVRCDPRPDRGQYDAHFLEASQSYDVPFELLKAVVRAESGFDPRAVSVAGAQGLMQLMPGTAAALGVKDTFDPAQNIDGGARYLEELIEHFGGDLELALAAYNAGKAAVYKHNGVPPFDETQRYVKRVLAYYRALSGEAGESEPDKS